MTLKLTANLVSQPSRAVIWTLKLKGVDFEYIRSDPGSAYLQSAEFKAINPNGFVPTLQDDDFVLTEGMAILTYLADKYGWTDLYPTDVKTRAKVNEFLHWHHTNTRLFTLNIFRPECAVKQHTATPKDLAALEAKHELVDKELKLLEAFLDKDYVAHTDAPTVADYAAYCEIDQLDMMGWDFSKYAKVAAWIARMKKIPFHDEVHEQLDGHLIDLGLRAAADKP